MNSPNPTLDLLPDRAKHPTLLGLLWLIPQAILFWLNWKAFQLVDSELPPEGLALFKYLLWSNRLLLVLGIALVAYLIAKRKNVSLIACATIFMLHVLYLLFVFLQLDHLLPTTTETFMLPSSRFLFNQFCFVMPVVFYCGVRLALFPTSVSPGANRAGTIIASITLPLGWYLATITLFSLSMAGLPTFLFGFLLAIGTAIAIAAIVRLISMIAVHYLKRGDSGRLLLAAMLGLVFPIGGLILNYHIPFPFDFQHPAVYSICILNGLLLLVPPLQNSTLDRLVWLGQTILFSFTLYFFLVFLPFTPLSMLAMVAFGAGLLILAPTGLFIFHSLQLARGFSRESTRTSRGTAGALMALCLVLPFSLYTAYTLQHKATIRSAIAHVYEKSPLDLAPYSGNRTLLRQTLKQMYQAKNGFELPFATAYYNWLVFDGLVLPDHKIQHLHKTFFGSELETEHSRSASYDFMPRNRDPWNGFVTQRPPADAHLNAIDWTVEPEGDVDRIRAVLHMENPTGRFVEYATTIQLPPYAMLSNFHLWIGEEKAPGRLFERKSAIWIYEKIRDTTRCDPGLLVYQNREEISLNIYPFVGHEKRKTEIEFLVPKGLPGTITIDGRSCDRTPESTHTHWTKVEGVGGQLSTYASDAVPATLRRPYLHFIIDRSIDAPAFDLQLRTAQDIARKYPDAAGFRMTLTNASFQDLTEETRPLRELPDLTLPEDHKTYGGFSRDRAIKRALLEHHRDLHGPQAETRAPYFPRVIVLQAENSTVLEEPLARFASLVPDEPYATVFEGAWNPTRVYYDPEDTTRKQRPVALLASGSAVTPIVARQGLYSSRFLDSNVSTPAWLELPSKRRIPIASPIVHAASSRYAKGTQAWLGHDTTTLHPTHSTKQLPEMVELSRETGVLLPETAYIVLENQAQYTFLEQLEQKKLKNSAALETPEPDAVILILGFLVYLLVRKHRKRI